MPKKATIYKETKLRKILQLRGWTQQDLINKIEEQNPDNPISQDSVSKIVNGKITDYKLCTVWRICNALDLSPNDLLDWEEEIPVVAKRMGGEIASTDEPPIGA